MTCPDVDTFNQLVSDKLDADARARVVDHAGSCDACRELISALLGMVSTPGGVAGTAVTAPPTQVDRYVIERLLGAGAMGVVYAAKDPSLDRAVAIKLLRGAGSAARLTREAQMLAKLHHPNVVAVYDVGEHDGQTFVAMALVDGENLRSWLAKPRETAEIVRVIRDAGHGLAAAHAAGLIHRDLKPDNIFVAHDGSVQVGDFGLARAEGERDVAAGGDGPLELTLTGMVLGTPAYMAPEHAAGEPTAASDQFSLCVTAWEALYGERPFAATNYGELQQAIVEGKIRKPPERDGRAVPARVRDILERGLRADPAERFPSVDALVAALAPPRRRWPWIAAIGVAGAAVATMIMLARSNPDPAAACAIHAQDLDDVRPQLAGSAVAHARDALDNYARDWLALRHDVCMSPRPGPSDPRVRCLDRAHDAMRELVKALPTIDPDRVYPAAAALPNLGDCKTALAEMSTANTIAGEQLLGKIESARVRIMTMRGDAQPLLDALAKEAEASGYAPAIVFVATSQAEIYARSGQPEAAEQVLHHAMTTAEANHDDRSVARIAASLAQVSVRSNKLDQARTMIELGAAALARAGGDVEIEIDITNARALIASAAGDHAAAIELITKLIPSMIARRGAHSDEVVELYIMLAREDGEAGRMKEAAEALAKVQFDQAKAAGADQATLVKKISEAFTTGQTARAVELSQQYVAMARELKSPEMAVDAAISLAQSYELGRDRRMMLDAYRNVLALLDKQPSGGAHELRGSALEGIGTALVELHREAEAVAPLQQAIDEDLKGGGVLDDQRASASTSLGRALLQLGKAHDARVLLEPIVRMVVNNPASIPQRRAGAEFRLAQALWDDGGKQDRARALALADDAERDYAAGLERVKTWPEALKIGMRLRVDELRAWRKRHE